MKKITLILFVFILSQTVSAQFTEGFDGSTILPAGWVVIDGGDVDNSWRVIDLTDSELTAVSGTNIATIGYSAEAHADYLITPAITVTAGVNDLFSFWGRSRDPGYPEIIDVRVSTTGNAAADFTSALQLDVAPPSGADFYKYTYDLTAYVGQTIYIGFYSSTTDEFFFDIDEVVSGPLPACLEPSGFYPSEITDSTATLNWSSTASAFQIEYGPAGFTPGTGTIVDVASGLPYQITGLAAFTAYDVYIRTDCGGGIYSDSMMITFTSAEIPATNDVCEDAIALVVGNTFESGAITATNFGATENSILVPTCQGSVIGEVWFTVIVPADGNISLETLSSPGSANADTVITAYEGACDGLTEIGCSDDEGIDNFSLLNLATLTPGQILYVAVWQYDSIFGSTAGQFQISAYNTSLATTSFDITTDISFYPNPVKDFLNLSYTRNISDLNVYNMLGQNILSTNIHANEARVNLSELPQGTYVVKVNADEKEKVFRIIKE